jgi:N utilization substance protein B
VIGARRRSRELALQILFCWDVGPTMTADGLGETMDNAEASADVRAFAQTLVDGVIAELSFLDGAIAAAADNWSVERLAVVDRNVLRLAVYELSRADDVPPAVAIDEAIELGKRYSTAQSGSFINGVLDRVRRDLDIVIDEPFGEGVTSDDDPTRAANEAADDSADEASNDSLETE